MSSENSGKSPPEIFPPQTVEQPLPVVMYNEFISVITSGKDLRRGQAWMIALANVAPDLYAEVTGTEADCFYNDYKINAFKAKVLYSSEGGT